jgi:hypothetical protein
MHYRGLTSLFSVSGFILMVVTGIILYIMPHGRVAYWTDWHFWGLNKDQWGNIHIIASFLWVVAGAFHLYFNWNVLTAYIYKKARGGWRLKKELALTIVVTVVVVVFSIYPAPPFSSFLDLGSHIKDSWVSGPEYEPPFGHAELLSLSGFSRKMGIDPAEAMNKLKESGLEIDSPTSSLETLARRNNISPMTLYTIIKPLEKKPALPASSEKTVYTLESVEDLFSGTGIGRKPLADVIQELNLDPEQIKTRMERKNLKISGDENLKSAADRYNVSPLDLMKAILIEDYVL